MKKFKITTPENIEVEYILADVGSRTAAALIDMAIQGLVMLLLFVAILMIGHFSPEIWYDYYGWIIGIILLINTVISYGYFITMELTMNGRTPGKRILKLRTIRNNGQPITLKHSAIRNLFRVFLDMYGLGIVWIFFSKERKRLGDFAASTIVVVEEDQTSPIALEDVVKEIENFSYCLSEEEYEVLRSYFERKKNLEDCSQLRQEIQLYFTKKFEDLNILDQMEGFIKQL